MYTYTKQGFGDCTPDYPEDTRPQCHHCNEHHDNKDSNYCSDRCWHLVSIGHVKIQIMEWIKQGDTTEEKIIRNLTVGGWFESMTDSSVGRFKRVIHALFEVKLAKAA